MVNNSEKELRMQSLLTEIASMYYEQGLTQSEIEKRISISRSRISRLLTQAREKGVVKISINYNAERSYELENILKRRFNLTDARVLNNRNMTDEQGLKSLGNLAAAYLEQALADNRTIGISWGKAVTATVKALKGNKEFKPNIVQIMGATIVEDQVIDVPDLMRKLIELFNGRGFYLNTPLYVENDYVRTELKKQPLIKNTLDMARKADIVLTGIGDLSLRTFSYVWQGYNIEKLMKIMEKHNAVGSLCAQAYDENGRPLENGLNERIMGLSLDELKKVKKVIGVAGGENKTNAVLGALRGAYVDVLVTDSDCANRLLDISNK